MGYLKPTLQDFIWLNRAFYPATTEGHQEVTGILQDPSSELVVPENLSNNMTPALAPPGYYANDSELGRLLGISAINPSYNPGDSRVSWGVDGAVPGCCPGVLGPQVNNLLDQNSSIGAGNAYTTNENMNLDPDWAFKNEISINSPTTDYPNPALTPEQFANDWQAFLNPEPIQVNDGLNIYGNPVPYVSGMGDYLLESELGAGQRRRGIKLENELAEGSNTLRGGLGLDPMDVLDPFGIRKLLPSSGANTATRTGSTNERAFITYYNQFRTAQTNPGVTTNQLASIYSSALLPTYNMLTAAEKNSHASELQYAAQAVTDQRAREEGNASRQRASDAQRALDAARRRGGTTIISQLPGAIRDEIDNTDSLFNSTTNKLVMAGVAIAGVWLAGQYLAGRR